MGLDRLVTLLAFMLSLLFSIDSSVGFSVHMTEVSDLHEPAMK